MFGGLTDFSGWRFIHSFRTQTGFSNRSLVPCFIFFQTSVKAEKNDAALNADGLVNILDLTSVAAAFGSIAAAPYSKTRK